MTHVLLKKERKRIRDFIKKDTEMESFISQAWKASITIRKKKYV